ncbi:hypothetical protein P4C99_15005 [Pontiellaceae bacterium B1224]|nr:hypothetical protein [Pontiellaceae bacterium B1224]
MKKLISILKILAIIIGLLYVPFIAVVLGSMLPHDTLLFALIAIVVVLSFKLRSKNNRQQTANKFTKTATPFLIIAIPMGLIFGIGAIHSSATILSEFKDVHSMYKWMIFAFFILAGFGGFKIAAISGLVLNSRYKQRK